MNETSVYDASLLCSDGYNTLYSCESKAKYDFLKSSAKFPNNLKDQLKIQCEPCQEENIQFTAKCSSDVSNGNHEAFLLEFQCHKEKDEYCFASLYNNNNPSYIDATFNCDDPCHTYLARYLQSQGLTEPVNYTRSAVYQFRWDKDTIDDCLSVSSGSMIPRQFLMMLILML
eukprot:NODE_101_length_20473_cov_0.516590.p6 type:complete len:172 gc:universal NODE_101_length_20473_cov_0.516590:6338-6853(+)